ncbi:MAG: glycosyltransferase family 2 protein [Candidatus Nanopelagicales bacterium]
MTFDVSAVVCAFGEEPHLLDVVRAIQASKGVAVEVIVVDNGSPACAGLPEYVRILDPGGNTGFAGGCNLGARAADGSTLVFVNSDAIVEPGCLSHLHSAVHEPGAGLVGATVLLADEPDVVNSWGNPVHLLGFSWAGGYGQPADEARAGARASVSGALFGVRRQVFLDLGGMDPTFFMYGEDIDLSFRTWLSGLGVNVLADARAWHHYDFSRNPRKMYLLERNRLVTILTTYRGRTLLALAPLMVAAELAVVAHSRRDGWLDQKLSGWGWLAGHRKYLRARRNRVQGTRRAAEANLLGHLTVALDPPARFGMAIPPAWQAAIDWYWRQVGTRIAGIRTG